MEWDHHQPIKHIERRHKDAFVNEKEEDVVVQEAIGQAKNTENRVIAKPKVGAAFGCCLLSAVCCLVCCLLWSGGLLWCAGGLVAFSGLVVCGLLSVGCCLCCCPFLL